MYTLYFTYSTRALLSDPLRPTRFIAFSVPIDPSTSDIFSHLVPAPQPSGLPLVGFSSGFPPGSFVQESPSARRTHPAHPNRFALRQINMIFGSSCILSSSAFVRLSCFPFWFREDPCKFRKYLFQRLRCPSYFSLSPCTVSDALNRHYANRKKKKPYIGTV